MGLFRGSLSMQGNKKRSGTNNDVIENAAIDVKFFQLRCENRREHTMQIT